MHECQAAARFLHAETRQRCHIYALARPVQVHHAPYLPYMLDGGVLLRTSDSPYSRTAIGLYFLLIYHKKNNNIPFYPCSESTSMSCVYLICERGGDKCSMRACDVVRGTYHCMQNKNAKNANINYMSNRERNSGWAS